MDSAAVTYCSVCTFYFNTIIYLDSHKSAGENLCQNVFSDYPQIPATVSNELD